MRKLVLLLTVIALGLLGAACSSDVGSCVAKPEAGAEVGVTPDAPAPQPDSPAVVADAAQGADAAVQDEVGGEPDGGQSGDATPAEADSGSD
jgi:hypothetical protein